MNLESSTETKGQSIKAIESFSLPTHFVTYYDDYF